MAFRLLGPAPGLDAGSLLFVFHFARSVGDVGEATRHLCEALAGLDVEASCSDAAADVATELCANAWMHGGRHGRIELRVAPSIVVIEVVDDGAWVGRTGQAFGGDEVTSRGRGLTRVLELCDEVSIECLVGETKVRCTLRDRQPRPRRTLRVAARQVS